MKPEEIWARTTLIVARDCILKALYKANEPLSVNTMALVAGVSYAVTIRHVRDMIRNGIISKSEVDKFRTPKFALTPIGRRVAARV